MSKKKSEINGLNLVRKKLTRNKSSKKPIKLTKITFGLERNLTKKYYYDWSRQLIRQTGKAPFFGMKPASDRLIACNSDLNCVAKASRGSKYVQTSTQNIKHKYKHKCKIITTNLYKHTCKIITTNLYKHTCKILTTNTNIHAKY